MITSVFFLILYGALAAVASPLFLFPDVSLSSNITDAISSASSAISVIDVVVPVSTIIAVFVAFVGVEAALFVYKGIRWSYQKLPGVK